MKQIILLHMKTEDARIILLVMLTRVNRSLFFFLLLLSFFILGPTEQYCICVFLALSGVDSLKTGDCNFGTDEEFRRALSLLLQCSLCAYPTSHEYQVMR